LIAGFSIDYLGYQPAYLMLAACPLLAFILLWFKGGMLPVAAVATKEAGKKSSSFDLLRDGRLRDAIIASGLISIAWDLYLFYFPIYGHSIGLSASVIGMVISTFAAAVFAIRVALPAMTRRWSEFQILLCAHWFRRRGVPAVPAVSATPICWRRRRSSWGWGAVSDSRCPCR